VGWSVAGLATPLMRNPAVTTHVEPADEPGSGPFYWLLLCRTVLGFFEAGHWPCALLTARQILTAKDRPLGNGLLQSGASLGAILVPLYVLLVRNFGGSWEVAFWTIGGIGLLWVPLWFALVRRGDLDHPAEPPAAHAPTPVAHAPGSNPLAHAPGSNPLAHAPGSNPLAHAPGSNPLLLFLRIYLTLFIIILGISVSWQFIREWLPKYLRESAGFSANTVDLIIPVYYISAELGCFAFGFFVRWLVMRGREVHSARIIGYAVFAVITAAAAVAPYVGGAWTSVVLIILAGAGILGLHPCYYALAQELPTRHMAFLSGLLAAAGWFVVGEVQKAMGQHIQTTGSYAVGFVLAGLAPVAGLLALLLLWRPARTPVRLG
jgi:ACS family hexuronate transporter-like MFS transporter